MNKHTLFEEVRNKCYENDKLQWGYNSYETILWIAYTYHTYYISKDKYFEWYEDYREYKFIYPDECK